MARQRDDALARISVADFAEATFTAVLRAIDVREVNKTRPFGPIIYGIIAWPDGFPEIIGPERLRETRGG